MRSYIKVAAWGLLACTLVGCALFADDGGGRNPNKPLKLTKSTPDKTVSMEVTGYCNCQKCCSWHYSWFGLGEPVYSYGAMKGKPKDVGITSSGAKAQRGTIAVDPKYYKTGTIFYVPGYGYGIAEDSGGAIKGNHIDLWFSTHESALKWGRKLNVPVKVWYPAAKR